MANQETLKLDSIIASRRAMLLGGGALTALALTSTAKAALAPSAYTDADILNFALNLEYLEANFYYLAAFGTTIDKSNSASTAAGAAVQGIAGVGSAGSVTVKSNPQVPFADARVKSYAIETAIEEGKHVGFLRSALGSLAVAQPNLNLQSSFDGLATAAGIGANFDPFSSDAYFLVGAYIFEDVGVSAYSGAAPLISTSAQGKSYLQSAAGILAVEAYHAGLVRTTINTLDPTNGLGYLGYTQKISMLRASLAKAVAPSIANPLDTNPDDIPLTGGNNTVSLAGASTTSLTIADADATNVIAFARTTTQVLNIVTAGGAGASGTKASGGFFPSGLNGTFS